MSTLNYEKSPTEAADAVSATLRTLGGLLSSNPELAIVVTSRQRLELAPATARAEPVTAPAGLQVSTDGRWFCVDGGRRVDIGRRGPMRRIFLALVAEHEQASGAGLDVAELQALAWPGQDMVWESGASRVYAAIATLRKLGLRDLITTGDDGYRLDAAVTIERIRS